MSAADYDARNRELNNRLLAPWSTPATAAGSRRDDVDVRPVDATASNDEASSDRQKIPGQSTERTPPMLGTPWSSNRVRTPYPKLRATLHWTSITSSRRGPADSTRIPRHWRRLNPCRPHLHRDSASVMAALRANAKPATLLTSGPTDAAADSRNLSKPPRRRSMQRRIRHNPRKPPLRRSIRSRSWRSLPVTTDPASRPPTASPMPRSNRRPPLTRQLGPRRYSHKHRRTCQTRNHRHRFRLRLRPWANSTPAPPAVGDKPAANPAQAGNVATTRPWCCETYGGGADTAQPAPAPATPGTQPVAADARCTRARDRRAGLDLPLRLRRRRYGQRLVTVVSGDLTRRHLRWPRRRPDTNSLACSSWKMQPRAAGDASVAAGDVSRRPIASGLPAVRPNPHRRRLSRRPRLRAMPRPEKPCVLSVLFQKIKAFRQSIGLLGLPSRRTRHHAARVAPVTTGSSSRRRHRLKRASQRRMASWHSGKVNPTSQAAPRGSNGTKPGDVAEEGKLFERVSFESFDKSPQR